ncbi:hypothetical protein VTL71DRAFT_14431 [Oculimacula yallundae]|uniref:Uncharacterized protein n=1 Tax=Oculimacula yallundae TaxID=86028 RepID=A0ABR4CJS6_9HELO
MSSIFSPSLGLTQLVSWSHVYQACSSLYSIMHGGNLVRPLRNSWLAENQDSETRVDCTIFLFFPFLVAVYYY